jgi:ABC-type amino acid transport substrate-binding protein
MQAQAFKAARDGMWLVSRAIALLAVFSVSVATLPAAAQTIDRIRDTGRITLGYRADARPFTSRSSAGVAEGYGAALCQQIADRVKTQLRLPQLAVEWVQVTPDDQLRKVQQGDVDLLCTPTIATLARRRDVAFSIPVFAGGNRAVVRTDTAVALRQALADTATPHPVWRGAPAAKVLEGTSIAVVQGTTTETWLQGRRATLQVDAEIVPVPDYRTGLQRLFDREVDVFFGERSLVLGAMNDAERENFVVLDRVFTIEQGALALGRGDDDFRLAVDAALSEIYASAGFRELYTRWFGDFNDNTRQFFMLNTLAQE